MGANDFFGTPPTSFPTRNVSALPPQMMIPSNSYDPATIQATIHLSQQSSNSSSHHDFPQPPPHYLPPLPPSRTSSLPRKPPSPSQQYLPSVQVTHPTPTKVKKYRRKSIGGISNSSENMHTSSPCGQTQLLPSTHGSGNLEVTVEPLVAEYGKPQRSCDGYEDEDSDLERKREELAEKQARAREKGRDRQRRKRERDKKAREDAKLPVGGSSSSLTTAKHLPIPARDPSSGFVTSLPLSGSAPSSVESSFSSLPLGTSSYSVSPGQSYTMTAGSTPFSGSSTPSTLFSPISTTPGTGAGSLPDGTNGSVLWGTESSSSTYSLLDLPVSKSTGKRSGTVKARAASTSVPGSAIARKTDTMPLPFVSAFTEDDPMTDTHPSKRRRSEPEQALTIRTENAQIGLGVDMGNQAGANQWPNIVVEERPKPRRTASDGVMLSGENHREFLRSPTPPPVPTLPKEYRRPSEALSQDRLVDSPMQSSSTQGHLFATILTTALNNSTDSDKKVLRDHLGLGSQEIESMKEGLAGFYDRWLLVGKMSQISLDTHERGPSIPAGTSTPTPASIHETVRVNPSSPIRSESTDANSFFTPTSRPSTRQRDRQSAAVPMMTSISYQTLDSQLASQTQTQSQSRSQSQSHTRQRSLSSASMMARGLRINPQPVVVSPIHGHQPGTPTSTSGSVALPGSGTSSYTSTQSDDTASPVNTSLQTPSTGQGSFPMMDQIGGVDSHWRSATDPTGARTYTAINPGQIPEVTPEHHGQWTQVQIPNTCPSGSAPALESPLSMAMQAKLGAGVSFGSAMSMPPPPLNYGSSGPGVHSNPDGNISNVIPTTYSQQASHFSTPNGPRTAAFRNTNPIPFTPPTPLPVRGQTHSAFSSGPLTSMPLHFNPTFAANTSQPQLLLQPQHQHDTFGPSQNLQYANQHQQSMSTDYGMEYQQQHTNIYPVSPQQQQSQPHS